MKELNLSSVIHFDKTNYVSLHYFILNLWKIHIGCIVICMCNYTTWFNYLNSFINFWKIYSITSEHDFVKLTKQIAHYTIFRKSFKCLTIFSVQLFINFSHSKLLKIIYGDIIIFSWKLFPFYQIEIPYDFEKNVMFPIMGVFGA